MSILAHLNGGPRDDVLVEIPFGSVFYVAGQRPWSFGDLSEEAQPFTAILEGVYEVRRDASGEPVPHALDGSVEFDWGGWR